MIEVQFKKALKTITNIWQHATYVIWFPEFSNGQLNDNKSLQLRTQNELATLSAVSLLCQSAMGRFSVVASGKTLVH